jgi:hypothetical protein
MVPKIEACLRAVTGGVPSAHVVDGRVALRAGGTLHRRGNRDEGDETMSATGEVLQRWSAVMMNNYGTRRLPWPAVRARW